MTLSTAERLCSMTLRGLKDSSRIAGPAQRRSQKSSSIQRQNVLQSDLKKVPQSVTH